VKRAPRSDTPYDYIVVGAGSAGCALAAGLADRPDTSVLVLEAGPRDRDPRIRLPATAADLWFGRLDWAYRTTPQAGCDGRVDTWPRGRVLGGSSSINAMMYVRGMDQDYDDWEAAGATGWNAATMREAFVRIEDDQRGPAPHRGVGGPLHVQHQRDPRPLSLAFLDACEELGIPRVDDYHVEVDGCALSMVTQRDGRRWSAADAFLRRHLADRGSRLTLRTGVEVRRLIVEAGRAVGVEVVVRGRRHVVRAEREVLVSAGAVGSPHLLLRSGIGPADHLRDVGAEVLVDRPGVGQNLTDHVLAGICAGTRGGSLYGADRDPRHLVRWLRHRRGPVTSNLGEAIAFVRSSPEESLPDLELLVIPGALHDHGRTRYPRHGLRIGAILLRPHSRGTIRLASPDPTVPPLVDPCTFSDPDGEDLRRVTEGLRIVQRLVTDTRALGELVEALVDPPAPLRTDAEFTAHARAYTQTLYHPVGTCRMGSDEEAVVDPQLRVLGVEGLRVVDASVMPNLIRGHTNAPSIAIGERAARLVTEPVGRHVIV
jgi:choline dehydrogenase